VTGVEIGIVGAGRLASAMLTGIGEDHPVRLADSGSGSAARLAERHARVVATSVDQVARTDLVFLAVPASVLPAISKLVDGSAECVVSLASGVGSEVVTTLFRSSPAVRVTMTATVAVRRGVICVPRELHLGPRPREQLLSFLFELGTVLAVDEALMSSTIPFAGVAPAYWAAILREQVLVAQRLGLSSDLARETVMESARAAVALIDETGVDLEQVIDATCPVDSVTSHGLRALFESGLGSMFDNAAASVAHEVARRAEASRDQVLRT
jgi:pyrroline-5-carboxylate reductase